MAIFYSCIDTHILPLLTLDDILTGEHFKYEYKEERITKSLNWQLSCL